MIKQFLFLAPILLLAAPIFAQETLFDSANANNANNATGTRRFRSLSEPSVPTTAQVVPTTSFANDADSSRFAAPTKKFVLTRLDEICEGTLRDRGDSLAVELENGGAISVSKLDVLFVGDSRSQIFDFKKSETRLDDPRAVLRLADWANRRQLGPEGIALLETSIAALTDGPERRAFERKLAELRESEKYRLEIARTLAVRNAKTNAAANANATATTDADADAAVDDDETSRDVASSSNAELDRWAKQIPFSAFDRFGRKAQPILQKRCATAGCHDGSNPNADGYVLQTKALGAATRLALLRNLRETFDFVDFENPNESPILNHPTVVDANGARVDPFGSDRSSAKDRESLADWVATLNDGKLGRYVHSPSRERPDAVSRRALVATAPAPSQYDVSNANAAATAPSFATLFDSDAVASDDVIRLGATDSASKYPSPDDPNSSDAILKRVGAIPERTYRDEYDPAIFNARYQTDDATRRY